MCGMGYSREPQGNFGNDRTRTRPNEENYEMKRVDKIPLVTAVEAEEGRETRPAKRTNWWDAILQAFIALLPLYFVGFCAAAYMRNGTLASSTRNIAILQLSKLVRLLETF